MEYIFITSASAVDRTLKPYIKNLLAQLHCPVYAQGILNSSRGFRSRYSLFPLVLKCSLNLFIFYSKKLPECTESDAMGFVEDELKHLRDVISGLDSRIKQLEQRATGSASIDAESLRMILIGPPGAGKCFNYAIDEPRR